MKRTSVMLILGVAALVGAAHGADPPAIDRNTFDVLARQARTSEELQKQIDLQLKVAPGGQQTAVNEVSYANGTFVVTYALPGQTLAGVPDCPNGWFCFYDNNNWGYPRGKLSSCGWQDLARYGWHDRTQSVDHRFARGTVLYINHFDRGNPGNGHSLDYEVFRVPRGSARPSVPAPNIADHVRHLCP